jgi:type IV pilus assembly protein PilN
VIKINLLKGKLQSGPGANAKAGSPSKLSIQEASQNRVQALIKLIIIILFPMALFYYESENIPQLKAEQASLQTKYKKLKEYNSQLKESADEIKKLQEDQARIEQQIERILKLSKDRLTEIKMLELIQTMIPERVWLSKMTVSTEKVNLSGIAMSDYDLSLFHEALSTSAYFKDVVLKGATAADVEKDAIKKFEIDCVMEKL